ncbi:putative membrane protein [Desulfitobacterium dichloroeliminans LMG P-21439]|uniref:Putative membrane protein n=1 Tax=Desulfitobacterium dichloroeliminans (strain LMG P-21439 / DCA1) TaxID=871963 RepID=L0F3X8_DESDL|nr:putative sulfate exporter family transporter [Desulfitobacterium dichloroeliminans]AGA67882.1 putative membrane protein [Desulfitobacterium dichloroeliminans LMG P-21439]
MSKITLSRKRTTPKEGFSALWKTEEYWAVWLGIVVVLFAIMLFYQGNTLLSWLVLKVPHYDDFKIANQYMTEHIGALLVLYLFFLCLFGLPIRALKQKMWPFALGFTVLFILSVGITVLGSWEVMRKYNIETPVLALIIGLILGNIMRVPHWMNNALKTDFYVKVGIVLMGASLPINLILQAGFTAFAQATIIAVATFMTIYWTGTRFFGLDNRFAATLAAGGSICGVSASIAIGGAVKAEKKQVSIAISLVVMWSIVMIFVLPLAINFLEIPPGPAGAWIGTAELADAPGMAAAAAINEQAIKTFTLMKVVGRDMFIGFWCFIMALFSVTTWERRYEGSKPDAAEIWIRFPKFVLGFIIASIIITVLTSFANSLRIKDISTYIISPIVELRNWTFIFTFLSIGLTSRFRDLTSIGWKPFAAFTTGILINVPLGYLLSVVVMGNYWMTVR